MTIFLIYLSTILISFGLSSISCAAIIKKLEREGIPYKGNETSFIEILSNLIQILLKLSIPGVNILIGISFMIKQNELYELQKNKILSKVNLKTDVKDDNGEKVKEDDDFLLDITNKMKLVAYCKYNGYEMDLQALYSLARKYYEIKAKTGFTTCNDVLIAFPELNKILVAIEARINAYVEMQEFQAKDIASLSEIQDLLKSAGITDEMSYEELVKLAESIRPLNTEINLTLPNEGLPRL